MLSSAEFMVLIGSWLVVVLAFLVATISAWVRLTDYKDGRYRSELPRFFVAEAIYTVVTMVFVAATVTAVLWLDVSDDSVHRLIIALAGAVAIARFMYVLYGVRAGIPYLRRKLGFGQDRPKTPMSNIVHQNVGVPRRLEKLPYDTGVDSDDTLDD